MLKIKGEISVPNFDQKAYEKEIRKFLSVEIKLATAEWLKAVLLRIPTYTGTARGTFAPLGRLVKVAVRAGDGTFYGRSRTEALKKRKKGTTIQGTFYQLGFGIGANYSSHKIFKESNDPVKYTFIFANELPYVLWNNSMPAPPWLILPSKPPWFAIEAGNIAFKLYVIQQLIPKIPSINKFIKFKSRKI